VLFGAGLSFAIGQSVALFAVRRLAAALRRQPARAGAAVRRLVLRLGAGDLVGGATRGSTPPGAGATWWP
jgi:hypothetical protein